MPGARATSVAARSSASRRRSIHGRSSTTAATASRSGTRRGRTTSTAPPASTETRTRRARAEIAPRLDAAVAHAGTRHAGLTIRGQRTRWASCSSTGAMSFNWRLLLAPVAVLDYVIEHEVCHLEVMDHSPRFWALLEERSPGWREHAAWLRRYGSTLVL